MSLFGTINNSVGALQAAQIGLQTVGNNIGNANTEGYIRQDLLLTTPAPSRHGNLLIGHGVRASAIVQRIDQSLAERMWDVGSDLSAAHLKSQALSDAEALLNDFNGGGLSDNLTSLNGALHDLSAQPNDPALRQFVVLAADSLAGEIQRTRGVAREYQSQLNGELTSAVDKINNLATKIGDLNLQIMTMEGGRALGSDATGLRDERYRALEELSNLVKVNIKEQETGSVTVLIEGDYLVADTHARSLYVDNQREENGGRVRFKDTNADAQVLGGRLQALTDGRDALMGGVMDGLDQLAQDLIRQFNTVHSQGQGKTGFESLTGTVKLDKNAALDQAGLTWPIDGGSFEINLVDSSGNHISQHRIDVRLGSTSSASNVTSIVNDISAIDGVTAEVLPSGEIHIRSDVPGVQFTFGEDNSGFVGAAGLNTLFAGHSAETIRINSVVKANPNLLAISSGGINQDTDTLASLVDLIDRPSSELGGRSIRGGYSSVLNQLSKEAANQKASTLGLEQFYSTLQSQHLAITGVNIDEEAIKMIAYQRAFQATSRVIAAASEMLEILTSL